MVEPGGFEPPIRPCEGRVFPLDHGPTGNSSPPLAGILAFSATRIVPESHNHRQPPGVALYLQSDSVPMKMQSENVPSTHLKSPQICGTLPHERGTSGRPTARAMGEWGMSTQIPCHVSGRDRAALLLLALGPDQSAAVLSRLDPTQAAVISRRLSELMTLTERDRKDLLTEFMQSPAPAEPAPPPPVEPAPGGASSADRNGARALDLSTLPRFPSRAVAATRRPRQCDPARFADLPVTCRAELAPVELSLAVLAGLGVGDVLTLGPSRAPQVEFVSGEGLRLAGTLTETDGRMTVELANG